MKCILFAFIAALLSGAPNSTNAGDDQSMSAYSASLEAVKKHYPFASWQRSGLPQYTPRACAAMAAIFDKLITELIAIGPSATEEAKIACFKKAIEATNVMNERDLSLIETGERESLCDLCNRIAVAAGIDPKKYGDGEGPASEWRDW